MMTAEALTEVLQQVQTQNAENISILLRQQNEGFQLAVIPSARHH